MDATSALADLTEISSQIEQAVVFLEDGSVLASTFPAEEGAAGLAATARELLAAAAQTSPHGDRELTQLEVSLAAGSVFLVRGGGRVVAATTSAGAPAGLVLYDLRTCLRAIEEADAAADAAPRRDSARKKAPADA